MEQMGSELYHKCHDYIVSYSCKPTSMNVMWNFPACADFYYNFQFVLELEIVSILSMKSILAVLAGSRARHLKTLKGSLIPLLFLALIQTY
jgi:hypothetical protein